MGQGSRLARARVDAASRRGKVRFGWPWAVWRHSLDRSTEVSDRAGKAFLATTSRERNKFTAALVLGTTPVV
jgi:hypothetical protein